MKIGIKQVLVIGAVVLVGGGLLSQQAIADDGPQAVPLTNPPAQTQTVNLSTGPVAGTPGYSGQASFSTSSDRTYYGMSGASENYGRYDGRGMGERGGGYGGMGGE